MEKTKKIKVYNESGLAAADFEIFQELQEDFKIMDLDRLMLLKKAIIERGFKYSFKAWKDSEGVLWIIDAHRRKQALIMLQSEGYFIDPIPYELIHAESKREAIEEIAFVNSQYSDINPDTELFKKYNIDLAGLPISIKELNINFGTDQSGSGRDEKTEVPGIPREAITKFGDLYTLNEHMIQCGDSEAPKMVKKLLSDKIPILMVTEPPYGVKYDPAWRDEAAKKGLIAYGSRNKGKVLNDDRVDWTSVYKLFPGDIIYLWHAGKYTGKVQQNIEDCNFDVISQIIWSKSNFAISRGDYHWKHEPCLYAVRKGKNHNWQGSRSEHTIWEIKANDFTNPDREETYGHGTQKPLECMARPIRNNTESGQIIYDPFIGSGTTLIACQELNRICRGQELLPNYVDVIVERWINYMRDNDLPFKIWRNGIELTLEEIEAFLVTRERISPDAIIKKETGDDK